jgi:hypothetical protein
VGEILASPKPLTCHLLGYDPDSPRHTDDAVIEATHHVPELEVRMRRAMVPHDQYPWDRARTRLTEAVRLLQGVERPVLVVWRGEVL